MTLRSRQWYREDIEAPTWLYRLYDADGLLLYVGVSTNPKDRFIKHYRTIWWPLVNRVRLEWHATRAEAFVSEKAAIISEIPIHNVARPKEALRALTDAGVF